ncbi:MAG: site-specific integrase [Lachnospiraceae bacterium]|nr:site-specific integrase [Lachnospiraceae bacterium]
MNTEEKMNRYAQYLIQKEFAENTRIVYLRQAKLFLDFMGDRDINKKQAIAYKQQLITGGKSPASINLYITALNCYLKYEGMDNCYIKTVRFRKNQCPDNIISTEEYQRLLLCAKKCGYQKYYCIMRTLAATGIRISELSGCTVEALHQGRFVICSKGRLREIYLPEKLIAELECYCVEEQITSGAVFLGNRDKPISRNAVYKMLIHVADIEGISRQKVHPHSFRHLFAVTYMKQYSDLPELADILGHSSLETTRIYTRNTSDERRKRMNDLKL